MNLKDQVPAQETCEALKEAGFPQDTLADMHVDGEVFIRRHRYPGPYWFAAPTLAEVLAALPNLLDIHGHTCRLGIDRGADGAFTVYYVHPPTRSLMEFERGESAVETAARLWLSLHEGSFLPESAP